MYFTYKKVLFSFLILFVFNLCFGVAQAATLLLSPASANAVVGRNLSVSVVVSAPDQAINAVSGVVTYPADLLEVVSLAKAESVISMWVQEPTFSNLAGSVNFEGVVLNPGFTGNSGKVLTINFRPKQPGLATLRFVSPNILANDGSGTNVLISAGQGQYQLTSALPEPVATPIPAGRALVLKSQTHPDQTRWYRDTSAEFSWDLPSDATAVRLLVDQSRDSVPSVLYEPALSAKKIDDLPEGVSYFHAQVRTAEGWQPTAHYRLQIDATPPDHLVVSEVSRVDQMDPQIKLKFDASDALSGIDRYEIALPGQDTVTWRGDRDEVYESEALPAGTHTITVRAFDRAGNMLGSSIVVTVLPAPSAWWRWGQKALAAFSLAIPLLAVILVLAGMLQRSHARFRAWRRKLRKEVHEAEDSVTHAFDLIREDLEKQLGTLERTKTKRALTREEGRILANIRKNLRIAERFIKKEVEDIEKEIA